jgi:ribosomal protein L34
MMQVTPREWYLPDLFEFIPAKKPRQIRRGFLNAMLSQAGRCLLIQQRVAW